MYFSLLCTRANYQYLCFFRVDPKSRLAQQAFQASTNTKLANEAIAQAQAAQLQGQTADYNSSQQQQQQPQQVKMSV